MVNFFRGWEAASRTHPDTVSYSESKVKCKGNAKQSEGTGAGGKRGRCDGAHFKFFLLSAYCMGAARICKRLVHD